MYKFACSLLLFEIISDYDMLSVGEQHYVNGR